VTAFKEENKSQDKGKVNVQQSAAAAADGLLGGCLSV
jgi:hypothetical protein